MNHVSRKQYTESRIVTDRTKANSKKWADVVLDNLKWCRQYDLDIIVRSHEWGNSHELYMAHTIKDDKPCKKVYTYLTQGRNLEHVASILHNYAVLFQEKHIFEHANIQNKQKVLWHSEKLNTCFECGELLDEHHKTDDTPHQNCLMIQGVKN